VDGLVNLVINPFVTLFVNTVYAKVQIVAIVHQLDMLEPFVKFLNVLLLIMIVDLEFALLLILVIALVLDLEELDALTLFV